MVAEDEDEKKPGKRKSDHEICSFRSTIQALALAFSNPSSSLRYPPHSAMKTSVRPLFSFLLLIVVVATLSCRFTVHHGASRNITTVNIWFRSLHSPCYYYYHQDFHSTTTTPNTTFDCPILNTTLFKLSEHDPGASQMNTDTNRLLHSPFENLLSYRPLAHWRRRFADMSSLRNRPRTYRNIEIISLDLRTPEFRKIWDESRRQLATWSRKKRYTANILSDLVDQIRLPIDGVRKKYTSCAVVGNSGILLNAKHGREIDAHEAVIRLNNARITGFAANVGSKTTISFVNSNVLHLCSRRRTRLTEDCTPCRPYGPSVPIVLYICQPLHFLDFASCNSSHHRHHGRSKSPMVITDPRFDVLCSRIVKYYSLRRFFFGPEPNSNRTLQGWYAAHDGAFFHYSSGMQAVMMAAGVCEKVSLYGFGKMSSSRHHYHTNQKRELGLHDYEAEYEFYRDLAERPQMIPFVFDGFDFPRVVIHR